MGMMGWENSLSPLLTLKCRAFQGQPWQTQGSWGRRGLLWQSIVYIAWFAVKSSSPRRAHLRISLNSNQVSSSTRFQHQCIFQPGSEIYRSLISKIGLPLIAPASLSIPSSMILHPKKWSLSGGISESMRFKKKFFLIKSGNTWLLCPLVEQIVLFLK